MAKLVIFRVVHAIFAVEFFNITPKMPLKHTILPLLLLLLASCSEKQPMKIIRLDLAPADSLTELRQLWYGDIRNSSPERDEAFGNLVRSQLQPLDSVEEVLGQAFDNIGVKLVGVINPYRQPIVVSDSIIFIGLNHYLGPDNAAYAGFPEYMRRLKTLRRLPVDVVEEYLFNRFTTTADSPTLLTSMLFAGAIHNEAMKMLPANTDEALVLGMTDDEYKWCRDNEQRIWQQLIETKRLYSSDPDVIKRLMSPSPAATLINLNAPGNTVQYIGLQIARAYERNTGLRALPTNEYINDNNTLVKSKYAPVNATL